MTSSTPRRFFLTGEFWIPVAICAASSIVTDWHWYVGLPAYLVAFGAYLRLSKSAVDELPRPPYEPDPSEVERLAELNRIGKLRRDGLMTAEEFDSEMARILAV